MGRKKTSRQDTVSTTCVEGLATLSGLFGVQARNFFRQSVRALLRSKQKKSKYEKRKDFMKPRSLLMAGLGGNESSPKCKGKKNDTIDGVLDQLESCEQSVKEVCDRQMTAEQNTTTTKCETATSEYRDEFIKLFVRNKPNAKKICDSVNSTKITKLKADIEANCKSVTALEKAQTEEKMACDEAYKNCRKVEREVPSMIIQCKEAPQYRLQLHLLQEALQCQRPLHQLYLQ